MESLAGKSLFPDAFEPRHVRDTGRALAEYLRLGDEYDVVFGKPRRKPYNPVRIDPFTHVEIGQNAYYATRDKVATFKASIGDPVGYSEGSRSDAMWNYRQALRYRDEQAAVRWMTEYLLNGGTWDGIRQSIQATHPLGGLSDQKEAAFLETLNDEDQKQLIKAIKYWDETATPGADELERHLDAALSRQ